MDIVTDFVPYLSNLKDASIAYSGVNPVTKERVGTFGRVIAGVFAVPVAGNLLKYVGKGGKYVLKGGKAAYEAFEVARAGSKIEKAVAKNVEREVAERAEKELAARAEGALAARAEKEAAQRAEKEGSAAVAGAAPKVNPGFPAKGRTQNCVNCAIATDATLAGRPATALPSKLPQPIAVLEKTYKGTFKSMADRSAIEATMSSLGPGSRAIVYVGGSKPGHVFNAVVSKSGKVKFIDGQTGAAASFDGYTDLRLLITGK
ncbi:MAG: toxin glutamine deamidase domain-containing protein [Deltaproteobacteria bacterium]